MYRGDVLPLRIVFDQRSPGLESRIFTSTRFRVFATFETERGTARRDEQFELSSGPTEREWRTA